MNFEGHSRVAGLFKCNPSNICAVFYQISTDSALARSLGDSWASCEIMFKYLKAVIVELLYYPIAYVWTFADMLKYSTLYAHKFVPVLKNRTGFIF